MTHDKHVLVYYLDYHVSAKDRDKCIDYVVHTQQRTFMYQYRSRGDIF